MGIYLEQAKPFFSVVAGINWLHLCLPNSGNPPKPVYFFHCFVGVVDVWKPSCWWVYLLNAKDQSAKLHTPHVHCILTGRPVMSVFPAFLLLVKRVVSKSSSALASENYSQSKWSTFSLTHALFSFTLSHVVVFSSLPLTYTLPYPGTEASVNYSGVRCPSSDFKTVCGFVSVSAVTEWMCLLRTKKTNRSTAQNGIFHLGLADRAKV